MLPESVTSVLLLADGLWWALVIGAWVVWSGRFESPGRRRERLEERRAGKGGTDSWDVAAFGAPIAISIGLGMDGLSGARLALFSPFLTLPLPWSEEFQVFGAVLLVIGLSLLASGAYLTAKHVYSKLPEEQILLERGPYRFVRHPIYLAFGLVPPGLLLLSLNLLALPSLMLFLHWGWRSEETELAERFGAKYVEYRNRTGAFFPRIRKRS